MITPLIGPNFEKGSKVTYLFTYMGHNLGFPQIQILHVGPISL